MIWHYNVIKMILRICYLLFLFLASLRFPSSKSFQKITKDRCGNSVLKLVRRFDRTDLYCTKTELNLNVLKYCLKMD